MSLVRRVARPMLASMFVIGGVDAFKHPSSKAAKTGEFLERVAKPLGLPQDPELLIRANGATMMVGGVLLGLGRFPRLAAVALAGTLVPTTLAAHAYWNEQDPAVRAQQKTQFFKNISLLGGLLIAAVDTEGKPGLAYRAHLAHESADRAIKTTRREARHAARAARREVKLKAVQAHDALS